MKQIIGAAIAGYVSIIVLVFGSLSLAYAVLGPDGAFQPASFEVTPTWIAVSMVLSAIAATIGGIVTVAAHDHRSSVTLLSAMVLIFGLLTAVQVLNAPDDPGERMRLARVTNFEAMMRARQPSWLTIVNPLLGVAGVLFGAAIRRRPA
jgi:hypothetical protein